MIIELLNLLFLTEIGPK